jgi:predicted anti-sigma-YlaC factor YlaD
VNCRECTDFLVDYVNGELPPAQQQVFEQHLQLCQQCVTYMESYKETLKQCRSVGQEPEPEIPEALVRAILAARQAKTH